LTRELVATDFRIKYQSSFLGYAWSLLRPLFMFVIMYTFFGIFIGAGSGIPNYSSYLLLGILMWNFFAEVTSMSVGSVVGQSGMLRKLYFPKYVIIVAVTVTALINLILNSVVLGVLMAILGSDIRWSSLLVIPLVLELAVFSMGCAFLLSALYVRFRDMSYIWDIFLQAGIYVTPVFYALSFVSDKSLAFAACMSMNPITQVIQDARYLLITPQSITLNNLVSTGWYRAVPIAFVVVFAGLSAWYFKRRAPYFAEEA
jgi:ABC-2 type transport system permease protein